MHSNKKTNKKAKKHKRSTKQVRHHNSRVVRDHFVATRLAGLTVVPAMDTTDRSSNNDGNDDNCSDAVVAASHPTLSRREKCTGIYLPATVLAVAVLLFAIGYSWLINVMAQVYADLSCLKLFNLSYTVCKNKTTTAQQERWGNVTVDLNNESAVVGLSLAVMQALMCPILCTLADTCLLYTSPSPRDRG